jgi:hypothetical protein
VIESQIDLYFLRGSALDQPASQPEALNDALADGFPYEINHDA